MAERSTESPREPAAAVVRPSAAAPPPTPEPATPTSPQHDDTPGPAAGGELAQSPYRPYLLPPAYQEQAAEHAAAALFSRRWHRAVLGLAAASAGCSAVFFALSASLSFGPLAPLGAHNIYWAGPLGLFVVVWDAYALVTPCFRPRHPGVTPAARVGVDLCIWVAGVICTPLLAVSQMLSARRALASCRPRGQGWLRICTDKEYEALQVGGGYYYKATVAILVFICLMTAIHFAIFVRACVETHRINSARIVIVVPLPDGTLPPIPQRTQTPSDTGTDRQRGFGWIPWRRERRTKVES